MNFYCICLPNRRRHADAFFKAFDIQPIYTHISTIDKLKQDGLDKLKQDGTIDDTYKLVNDSYYGKMACSLSHKYALEDFIKSNEEVAIIFEDDNHIPLTIEEINYIKKSIHNTLKELDSMNMGWKFCNLSPCLSNSLLQKKVSDNLYTGYMGECMSAYMVSKSGARYLVNRFPLDSDHYALDTYLPFFGVNYPLQVFETHPRLFRQKDNHFMESTNGNMVCAAEYAYTVPHTKKYIFKYCIYIAIFLSIYLVIIFFILNIKRKILLLLSLLIGVFIFFYPKKINTPMSNFNIKWNEVVNDYISKQEYKYPSLYNSDCENYRLGDMILLNYYRSHADTGEIYHLKHFPDSIASGYMKQTKDSNNIDILWEIVNKKSINKDNLPTSKDLVIHLRLGDAVENSENSENFLKIPYKPEDFLIDQVSFNNGIYTYPLKHYYDKLKIIKKHGIKNIILVTGSHKNLTSYSKSHAYINCIHKFFEDYDFNVSTRIGNHADDDFIFMSNSKFFSKCGGGYSALVSNMVEKSNNIIL